MDFGDLVGECSPRGVSWLTHCVDLIFSLLCVCCVSLGHASFAPPSVGFRRTESWKRQHILEREKLASESIKALSQCSFVYIYVSCWVVSCSCTAGIPLIREHIEIFQRVPQSNSPPQLTAGTSFLITSSRLQFSSLPAAQCEKSRPLSGNKFPWMEAVLPSHDRRRSCNKLTAASSSQLLHPAWLL